MALNLETMRWQTRKATHVGELDRDDEQHIRRGGGRGSLASRGTDRAAGQRERHHGGRRQQVRADCGARDQLSG